MRVQTSKPQLNMTRSTIIVCYDYNLGCYYMYYEGIYPNVQYLSTSPSIQ